MSNKAVAAAQEDGHAQEGALDARLAAIPGLDAEKGLRHVRGRMSSYERLLKTFAQTRAGDQEAMRVHLAAGNHAGLAEVAHNIQGVAGFLGAMRICSLAADITAAQRRGCGGEEIAPLAFALIEAQAELAFAVQSAFGDSSPTPP